MGTYPAKIQEIKEHVNLLKLELSDNYTTRKRFNELEILVHQKTGWTEFNELQRVFKLVQAEVFNLVNNHEGIMERIIKLEALASKNEDRFVEHQSQHHHEQKSLEIVLKRIENDTKEHFEKVIKEKEEQIRKIELVQ